jgi:hypothetical protein
LREEIVRVVDGYNPPERIDHPVELRSLSVPVFGPDGCVVFTLTVWGPPGTSQPRVVDEYVAAALEAAAAATRCIGGAAPGPEPAVGA